MIQNMPSDALCADLTAPMAPARMGASRKRMRSACRTVTNGPDKRANACRGLTPTVRSHRTEGFVKPTCDAAADCHHWTGNPRHIQREAAHAMTLANRQPSPWDWITPTCGSPLCIEASHLIAQGPVRLNYPHRICIYCGRHGQQRDHLLPRNWTGDLRRRYVVTVPSCGTCNSLLGDTLTWSITERRAVAHARIRRKFAKALRTKDFCRYELAEFGPTLLTHIEDAMAKKAEVLRMLAWPTDPAYDARALQHSGIEDPWAVGLILPDDADLADYVARTA